MPFDNPATLQESDFTKKMRKAFALIDTPAKWCQGAATRTIGGQVQCCSGRAMQVAFESGAPDELIPPNVRQEFSVAMNVLLSQVPRDFGPISIILYNDNITHKQLCKWWERAIEHSKIVAIVGA